MKNLVLLGLIALSITGCAVKTPPVAMQAAGGSKADGTVKMMHQYSPMWGAVANIDKPATKAVALKRCERWGYKGVEAFASFETCISRSDYGCTNSRITAEFQCID